MPPTILFCPLGTGPCREMLPIILALPTHLGEAAVLDRDTDPSILRELYDHGIRIVNTEGKTIEPLPPQPSSKPKSGSDEAQTPRVKADGIVEFFKNILRCRSYKKRSRALLKHLNATALVMASDRNVGWQSALVAAANSMTVPSLIVPFALSNPKAIARERMKDPQWKIHYGTSSMLNRIAMMLFPRWGLRFRGEKMLFYPASRMLAGWMFGMTPGRPWVMGGGRATRMAVESEWYLKRLVAEGLPKEKTVVTGKPTADAMVSATTEAFQRAVRQELGVGDRPVIFLSMPQNAEHGTLSWEEHWKETEFLLSSLSQIGNSALVVSLHPKSNRAEYVPVLQKHGAILTDRRFYEILPLSRVFVATNSSTVSVAMALGKPSVVIDFYGIDDDTFDAIPGVLSTRDKAALRPALERLLNDDRWYEEQRSLLQKKTNDYLPLDERSTQRVLTEIERLMKGAKYSVS